MLIVRCAVPDLPTVQILEASGAFLADTLLYFEASTVDVPQITPIESISIRVATETDAAEIATLAATCFKDYQGHYHADSRLDRAACDALYVDWAVRSVTVAGVADVVLVADQAVAGGQPRLVGFTTLRATDADTYDIGLTAVHPQYHRQGINRLQLRQAQAWSHSVGGRKVTISTQVSNLASQRAAVRAGFVPSSAFYTLHWWL
jgi:GNAT superfamily N-acetyltransferase